SKQGIDDYIELPVDPLKLAKDILKEHNNRVRSRALTVLSPLEAKTRPYFLFRSTSMRIALANLPKIAASDHPVLITGETGTGKELVARAIHFMSRRSDGPFIAINCGAIPEGLIEEELFGHEKGAFTGAHKMRRGKFELANDGTLLLDEIGDMPLLLQVRLLRVLEEGQIYRIGSERPISINVRVIASTRQNLEQAIEDGLFREDLYYRLNVLSIHLPPLRERKEDIPFLAQHFLDRACAELGCNPPYPILSNEAIALLQQLPWRGNVRELRNLMIRVATLLPPGIKEVSPPHIIHFISGRETCSTVVDSEKGIFIPFGTPLSEVEDMYIRETLKFTNGNKTKAAALLGISVRTLRRKINKKVNPEID
ncbi:MAG: sigma-54-dependent Fis family transcriptional regulator, partial [Nitrospirae bacterium]